MFDSTDGVICAKDKFTEGDTRTTKNYDHGRTLVCNGALVGFFSMHDYSDRRPDVQKKAIYVDATYHRDWILDNSGLKTSVGENEAEGGLDLIEA